MDCDQSSNDARSSEPITESPTQEYVLPNHQDGIKLESNVSNQGVPGSGSSSKLPAQEHFSSRSQEGQEPPVAESSSDLPMQEHIFPRNQEDEGPSAAMAVHGVINDDNEQTAISIGRSSELRPVNIVSEECSYSTQSDSSRRESREQFGRPDSQQPQLENSDGSSELKWRESNMAQTWDSSARIISSVDDQRRTGAELIYPWNHDGAGPPVLYQGLRSSASCTTFDTLSHGGDDLSPLQMTTLPLPETSGPLRNRCSPPTNNNSLPSISELVDIPQVDRWRSRPNYQWSGYLPDIYETRRLESQPVDGRPPLLVQGPTQHLGPPLKPFDGPKFEEAAREQWRRAMREREIREAQGL